MITLGSWSDDVFRGPAADPAENLTFLERMSRDAQFVGAAHNDEWQGPMRPGLSALYDAAERQTRLVDASSARRAASEDVYDRMIAEVRRATGEDWDNPLRRNTTELAGRIARGEFSGWQDPRLEELIAGRQDAFLGRLADLKAKLGDRLKVDPWTPIPTQARANAAQAEADFKREWAREDLPLAGQVIAMFAGAMVGSREDPLFWGSLPFGGPSKNAVTPVGRIATSALSNAVANAGFSALAQPVVQGWRREIGVEHGLGEAAQNVGMAFGIGGIAGGGLTGIGEIVRGLRGPGSASRAVKAIEDAGGFVDDDTRAALRAAEMAGEADDATVRAPEGVNPAEAAQGLTDAMRAAVEVDAPLPMGSRPVRPGVTDRFAREILDGEADPVAALSRLREDPAAIESAISSELPDVRAAGYAATLGDAAFARVASGEADPIAASVVARMADAPEAQAALLARVIEAGARTEETAREVVSDAIRAQNALRAAEAVMAGSALDVDQVMRRRAPQRHAPLSLIEFLAANGGLKPAGDLEAIFSGQKFVPGYGQLIRPNGQNLDRAFEAALEAGYFRDARADAGGAYSINFNDMLTAIEAEHRGRKLYAERDLGEILDRQEGQTRAEIRRDVETAMERFFADMDIPASSIDEGLWKRTRQMLERGEANDPDIAFERAVMEDSHRFEQVLARRKEIVDDIPGWDIPDDRRAAPRPRQKNPPRADARSGEARATGQEPRAGSGDAGREDGPFGPVIDTDPAGWSQALARASALDSGEIRGALHHPDVGPIDAPWRVPGDEAHGLSGLIARGRGHLVERLPELIEGARLADSGPTRAHLVAEGNRIVIRLDWQEHGGAPRENKRWVLTIYEPEGGGRPALETPSGSLRAAEDAPQQPAGTNIAPEAVADNVIRRADPAEIRNLVPMTDEAGNLVAVDRASAAAAGERSQLLADLVTACKV